MFDENKKLVFTTFQIVVPSLEGFNNSQEFTIMSFNLSFNQYYFSGEKSY